MLQAQMKFFAKSILLSRWVTNSTFKMIYERKKNFTWKLDLQEIIYVFFSFTSKMVQKQISVEIKRISV